MKLTINTSAARMGLTLGIAMALVAVLAGPVATAQPLQQKETPLFTKAGWWIKVDASKTTAESIAFHVGTKDTDRKMWREWKTGDAFDFDVPKELQMGPELYLQAVGNPAGRAVRMCVYYQGVGVKELDFKGDKSEQIKQADRDNDCR